MIKFFLAILFVVVTGGCTSPLSKIKCVYDVYGDSTVYYEIIINGDYLRTTKYKHVLLSSFDNLKKTWHTPVDSVFEKKDSVFLNRELQDSLIFHIENAVRNEKRITSYISTNTSKITMTWNKRTYELQYHNMKQRGLISFLKNTLLST